MAMVSEFVAAINQICSERGIEAESVYTALEQAVLAAYIKEYGGGNMKVEMDRGTGEFKVIAELEVVEKVEDKRNEISLKAAQKIQKGLELGDVVEMEKEVEDFGRIAAQTAKQVVMQSIREAEKDAVLEEYSDKVGEVFAGMMQRMQNGQAVFEIGKAMAFMPPDEQVGNEFYRVGDRYKVLLKGIEDDQRGKSLIVSRSDPQFLIELFRMEVPEIESGVVEVKACAREAGSRSKMAVDSSQEGIDPIGSCVGQRGMRIANVMGELGEEKIDVIEWREDLAEFVEKALSPAQVMSVEIKDDDLAVVVVDEDQLSLAIGKDGQNVRLAAKLTELRIDIQGPDGPLDRGKAAPADDNSDDNTDDAVADDSASDDTNADDSASELDAKYVKKLETAGSSVEAAKEMDEKQLQELKGIGAVAAKDIYNALN